MKRQALIRLRRVQETIIILDVDHMPHDALGEVITEKLPADTLLNIRAMHSDEPIDWHPSDPYVVGVSVEEVHPDDDF